jgi:suppressor for copper-sensitivity B
MKLFRCIFFILILFNISFAYSTDYDFSKTDQAKVSFLIGSIEGGKVTAALNFDLDRGWKIYWKEPGDTGYPPVIDSSKSDNLKSLDIKWPAPYRFREKLTDDVFLESYGYEGDVLFPLSIEAENPQLAINLNMQIDYAICKEICIPAKANLLLELPASYNSPEHFDVIEQKSRLVPQINEYHNINISRVSLGKNQSGDSFLQIAVESKEFSLKDADIFVEAGDSFAFYNPVASVSPDGLSAIYNISIIPRTGSSLDEVDITLSNKDKSVYKKVLATDFSTKIIELVDTNLQYSLWIIILFAFLGGLILNVMPCVLPVLSIKILSILKYSKASKTDIILGFLITAFGIICSFAGLALVVTILRSAGANIGWGFHFQEPVFIITLVIILVYFAANLWGLYEFRMPFAINSGKSKNNLPGYFLTGVLATVLATPCTAPFLGVAVGFAITRSPIEIFIVFTAMGVGMSLPYLLFCIFPSLVYKLPKPGKWMLSVKNFMGVLLAITAVWLLWVLSKQIGITAAIILAVICIIKLCKIWAASHFNFLENKAILGALFVILTVLAFALPLHYKNTNTAYIYKQDETWQRFQKDDISSYVADGHIVFVDVTADWCLTCKVNKLLVLDSREIVEEFKNKNVIAMRADWTNKDDDITNYLLSHGRVGVPFNIIFGPDAPNGIILSELLDKKALIKALNKAKNK